MIGSYHGTTARVLQDEFWLDKLEPAKQGNVAHYDGHVSLSRDPWPYRHLEDVNIFELLPRLVDNPDEANKLLGMLLQGIFAQRGINFTVDMVVALLNN
jgi:prepilin-type processing-associated H-X9-DG protein